MAFVFVTWGEIFLNSNVFPRLMKTHATFFYHSNKWTIYKHFVVRFLYDRGLSLFYRDSFFFLFLSITQSTELNCQNKRIIWDKSENKLRSQNEIEWGQNKKTLKLMWIFMCLNFSVSQKIVCSIALIIFSLKEQKTQQIHSDVDIEKSLRRYLWLITFKNKKTRSSS